MSGPRFYDFGPYRLDAADRLLFREGALVSIAPRALDTLVLLVGRHGRVVSKDEIMECFLQVAVYCGVPAGLESTNLAREVFKERGI